MFLPGVGGLNWFLVLGLATKAALDPSSISVVFFPKVSLWSRYSPLAPVFWSSSLDRL